MRRRIPIVSEIRVEPDSPTATMHLGRVQRHVGSVDYGVDFHIRRLGNRNSNAAADNYVGVTDLCDLAGDLPEDSVGKLGYAVRT